MLPLSFFLNRNKLQEVEKDSNSLAIMAVDNLPSELPRDSSCEFGNALVKEVMPYLIKDDDGRIEKATITLNGFFLPTYIYIKNYLNN